MTKEEIISARKLTVSNMIDAGFTLDELFENGEISREYYSPSDSYDNITETTVIEIDEESFIISQF